MKYYIRLKSYFNGDYNSNIFPLAFFETLCYQVFQTDFSPL